MFSRTVTVSVRPCGTMERWTAGRRSFGILSDEGKVYFYQIASGLVCQLTSRGMYNQSRQIVLFSECKNKLKFVSSQRGRGLCTLHPLGAVKV